MKTVSIQDIPRNAAEATIIDVRTPAEHALFPPSGGISEDLPLIAAALAHYERASRQATMPATHEGRRSRWGAAARREALRS